MPQATRHITRQEALLIRPQLMERLSIGGLDACWEWKGPGTHGYGQIGQGRRGQRAYVHRIAYILWRGEIQDNLTVDHLCRNRGCANPRHLEIVTLRENLRRGNGFPGLNARKTHCDQGHEFTLENTYQWKRKRKCRICRRERNRQWRHRTRDLLRR